MFDRIIYQDKNMITYKDLCNGLTKLQEENYNDQVELTSLIGNLADFFASDLGLLGKKWKGIDDKIYDYVSILSFDDNGKSQVSTPVELKYIINQRTVSCHFGLQVTLEKNENTYPKTNLFIKLTAKKQYGKISIAINSEKENLIFEINKPFKDNLSHVNDAIKQSIMNIF